MNSVLPELGPAAINTSADLSKMSFINPRATELARSTTSVNELDGQMASEGCYVDAIRLLGATMSIRAAIWWLAVVSWRAAAGSLEAEESVAVGIATHWVRNPTEANWAIATKRSDRWPLDRPGYCCGKAVVFAGYQADNAGSWENAAAQQVARLVSGGIKTAAIRGPVDRSFLLEEFYLVGKQIVAGELDWNESTPH